MHSSPKLKASTVVYCVEERKKKEWTRFTGRIETRLPEILMHLDLYLLRAFSFKFTSLSSLFFYPFKSSKEQTATLRGTAQELQLNCNAQKVRTMLYSIIKITAI